MYRGGKTETVLKNYENQYGEVVLNLGSNDFDNTFKEERITEGEIREEVWKNIVKPIKRFEKQTKKTHVVIPAKRPYWDREQYEIAAEEMRRGLHTLHQLEWAIGDVEDFDKFQSHPIADAFIGNLERWLEGMGRRSFPKQMDTRFKLLEFMPEARGKCFRCLAEHEERECKYRGHCKRCGKNNHKEEVCWMHIKMCTRCGECGHKHQLCPRK